MRSLFRVVSLILLTMIYSSSHAEEPPIGFVVHQNEGSLEKLDDYGVTAELANVFVWKLKSERPLTVDFSVAAGWLKTVENSQRFAYPIIDTSVFHSTGWRATETGAKGENLTGPNGKAFQSGTTAWSSLYSPAFRKTVFEYSGQIIDWIKANDTQRKIPAYVNGAEWFMPGMVDYHPMGIQKFQEFLQKKYGRIETLNEQWGAHFKNWSEVTPPRGELLGDYYVGMRTVGFSGTPHADIVSADFAIESGKPYQISVRAKPVNVPKGLFGVQLQCLDAKGQPIVHMGDGQFYWADIPNQTMGEITGLCRIPEGAKKARVVLKLMGPGSVEYFDPKVTRWPADPNLLLANGLAVPWKPFAAGGVAKVEERNGEKVYSLSLTAAPLPYQHTGLAWDEWITFSYESMAEWLNECALFFKEKDPSRAVMSYVGCVFGMATLGDFNTYWQRLDISLANSPAIDINGIQVCTADRDYTMVTGPIDLARKYGKPIYLTDIVDFPYGLFSGFNPIYRGALTAVQHGADGIMAYCWLDSVAGIDYQYLKYTSSPELTQFVENLKLAVKAVEGCEVMTDIAFLLPMMPHSLADEGGYKSDALDLGGWGQLLNDAGLITDFYTPYELTKKNWDLKKYKVIILPDCPVLPEAVNDILCDYVAAGGTVIGAGRPPTKNLRGLELRQKLTEGPPPTDFVADRVATNSLRNEDASLAQSILSAVVNAPSRNQGKGKVIWIGEKLGKGYWGQARRGRDFGNTPAVYLKPDYTLHSEQMRQRILSEFRTKVQENTANSLARVTDQDSTISVVSFANPSKQTKVLFLMNSGIRSRSVSLSLPPNLASRECEVWTDFDRRVKVTAGADGKLILPGFADAALVTFPK